MADNELLLKFGLDEASFNKLISDFVTQFKTGVRNGLADLDVGNAILSGRGNLVQSVAVAIKSAVIESKLGAIIGQEILIGATDGGKNISEAIKSAVVQSRLSQLVGNEIAIGAADGAKSISATIRAAVTQSRVEAATAGSSIGVPASALAGLSNFPQLAKEITQYAPDIQKRFDDLHTSLTTVKDDADKGSSAFKGWAFNIGLIGYGMENLGRRLLSFSSTIFNSIKSVATITEQFERLKNALIVEGTPESQRNSIENKIKEISLLPGGKLVDVTKSFQEIRTAGLGVAESLQLIEGLTKATTLSGKGSGGVDDAVKILRRALLAQDNPFKTQTVDTLEAQVGPQIAAAMLRAFGSVDAKTLNKKGGAEVVAEITKELNNLQSALPVPLDTINHIEDTVARIGESIVKILEPALEKASKTLLQVEDIIANLQKRFDGLSAPTKDFISELLYSIPIIAAALGGILSTLGVLTVGAAVVGKSWKFLSETFSAMGKGVSEVADAATKVATVAEEGGAAVVETGSALTTWVPIVGQIVVVLTAYATNLEHFRDNINTGIAQLLTSFEDLYTAISKTFDSNNNSVLGKFVGFIVNEAKVVGDVISGIIGVVGSAIGTIFGLVSDVIELIAGIITAFNQTTLTGIFQTLSDTVGTFLMHIYQRVIKLFADIGLTVINVFGKFLVRVGGITQAGLDDFNNRINDVKNSLTDTNYVIKNSAIVLKDYGDSSRSAADQLLTTTDAIKLQTDAWNALTLAVGKNQQANEKNAAKAQEDIVKEQIAQIKEDITTMGRDFQQQLEKEFDPNKVDSILTALVGKLEAKKAELNKLEAQIGSDKMLDEITKLGESDLRTKTQNVLSLIDTKEAVEANAAVTSMVTATTYAEVQKNFNLYKTLSSTLLDQGLISQGQLADLQAFSNAVVDAGKKIKAETGIDIISGNKSVDSAIAGATKVANARHDSLVKQHENHAMQLENATLDVQINALENSNAQIADRVAKFELTTSKARLEKAQNDKQIAQLKADQAKDKIQRDLNDLQQNTPGDTLSISEKQEQLAAIDRQLVETQTKIDSTSNAAQAKADDAAVDARLKRLQESGKSAMDIIKPFETTLFHLFAQTTVEGLDKTSNSFIAIATTLNSAAGSLPEIKDFTDALLKFAGGDQTVSPVSIFERLLKMPAQTQLQTSVRDALHQLDAIVLSEIEFDDQGKAVSTTNGALSPLLASALGIDPITGDVASKTRDQLKTSIEKTVTTVDELWKLVGGFQQSAQAGLLDSSEVESFIALVTKAASAQAELQKVNLTATSDTLKQIDTALETLYGQTLDAKLSDVQLRLNAFLNEQSKNVLASGLIEVKELTAQQIQLNFQKEDLNLQFHARELVRERENAGRIKEIYEQLEKDRTALRLKAETDIRQALGMSAGEIPTADKPKPIDVPGTPKITVPAVPDGAPKSKSIFDALKANIGDFKPLDTVADKLKRVSDAYDKVYASARQARQAASQFFSNMADGSTLLDTLQAHMDGTATKLDVVKASIETGIAMFASAFAQSIEAMLTSGDGFTKGFGKIMGQLLIMLGEALLQMGIAALAVGLIRFLFGDVTAPAMGTAAAIAASAAGVGLIALGAAMGGGSQSSTAASTSNSTNTANSTTGATGNTFDPTKDPKTIYQKAMQAQVLIDIRTDDSQIVKVITKEVNSNGRLTNLIGNSKLSFGM